MLRLAGSSPASRKTKICESSSVVELHLAKVDVAGSSPVFRSLISPYIVRTFYFLHINLTGLRGISGV